jgi:uncharacterized protein involved in response to NO
MTSTLKRLFSEGWRVFFLSAGLYALLAVAVWEIWLATAGALDLPVRPAPHLWHAHEMIFGYGSAALAGFFLTAVPNWTGAKGAPQRFIALAAGVWLAGRLALWFSGALPPVLVALADLAFVPLLWGQMLGQLIRRPKPPQMIFLGLLALFWAANLLVHLDWLGLTGTLDAGIRGGLLTLVAMIVVLGGRVTPGFTRNAMVAAGREDRLPVNPAPLAVATIAAALALVVAHLLALPAPLRGGLALVAGAGVLVRVALWRGGWTLDKPILWVLHLSYAVNGLGLILLGLADLGQGSEVAALHVLGIGGVGGMTVGVMSRASLGHSGRALVAPRAVAVAYALLPLAALARFAGSAWPEHHYPAVLAAGALWLAAFGLHVVALWPVWLQPRAPRAPVNRAPA